MLRRMQASRKDLRPSSGQDSSSNFSQFVIGSLCIEWFGDTNNWALFFYRIHPVRAWYRSFGASPSLIGLP